ncbi:MAG: NUDIX hydrolase [Ignavibacteriales bacterium]|nr:NUDIX hydrolase [Ignavibacteriales bacterium]
MSLHEWKKKRQISETKNRWWSYRKDEVILPSGKEGEYHFVHTNGSSMVIPVLDDGKLIVVKQYRYLAERESIEFACGSVKDGSTYEKTAMLELAEETGYAAGELSFGGEFNPYNGVTDEMCKIYIARKLTPVTSVPDETEEFEKIIISPPEFEQKIETGEIWDGMTLAAWMIVRKNFLK